MDETQLAKIVRRHRPPLRRPRIGGYTRVVKAGIRMSDAASIAIIEFVDRDVSRQGPGQRPGDDDEDAFAEA